MKKLLIVAFLGLSQFISAQVTQNVGDFTTVRAFDRINVTLIKSSENKVEIKGNKASDVEVVTKNGDLKIRMKVSQLLNGDNIEATVYYTGKIDRVEASEGAFVGSADTFKATAFELNAKEGATVKLSLDVAKLKSKASSGGILEITGKSTNHQLSINSGGTFKGNELTTTQTAVSITAGGYAEVNASEFADAKTNAGGEIKIYGNPQQVNQKSFAGGSINIVK